MYILQIGGVKTFTCSLIAALEPREENERDCKLPRFTFSFFDNLSVIFIGIYPASC